MARMMVAIFLIGLILPLAVTSAAAQSSPVTVFLPLVSKAAPGYGVMVAIPTGSFWMGCDENDPAVTCSSDQLPLHEVFLDAYEIDQYEVTNEQYQACIENGYCSQPVYSFSSTRPDYFNNPDYKDYPVIYVTYSQAWAYCHWAGKRLPTEAEWEKAARGGADTRSYPWGSAPPDCTRLNADYCTGDTTRVGSFPDGASRYGLMDMSGNVAEWVADWYDASYYQYSPAVNPPGPYAGMHRVIRGGSWFYEMPYNRLDYRFAFEPDDWKSFGLGFRCARSAY